MRSAFFLFTVIFLFSSCSGSLENAKTIEFKVWGNCGMCKKTIEKSLKDQPGLYSANWNVKTKQMQVVFDSTKIQEQEIHRFIASSGYDTALETGDSLAYSNLHSCCKYDRKAN